MRQKLKLTFLAALIVAFGLASGATVAAQESDGVARITLEEFRALMSGGSPFVVLDVRGGTPDQKIKGSRHIPLDALEARLKEIPRDRAIITYCA
ncbi:MAG TPA: rhodanese-like domain-containing protein [Pyrinomonadaceae bacterium]|nr:rhodanese-like domain-containing protein [Pyrinomonadaceae bacterium]